MPSYRYLPLLPQTSTFANPSLSCPTKAKGPRRPNRIVMLLSQQWLNSMQETSKVQFTRINWPASVLIKHSTSKTLQWQPDKTNNHESITFLITDTYWWSYQRVVVNVRHHILLMERHHLLLFLDTVCVPFCIRASLAMPCQSNIVFLSGLHLLDQSPCIQESIVHANHHHVH